MKPCYHWICFMSCISDIDECTTGSGDCEQHCDNIRGSFKCTCPNPGFITDGDNPTRCVREYAPNRHKTLWRLDMKIPAWMELSAGSHLWPMENPRKGPDMQWGGCGGEMFSLILNLSLWCHRNYPYGTPKWIYSVKKICKCHLQNGGYKFWAAVFSFEAPTRQSKQARAAEIFANMTCCISIFNAINMYDGRYYQI